MGERRDKPPAHGTGQAKGTNPGLIRVRGLFFIAGRMMNKKECLERCRDLWDWLAKDGTRQKWRWPGWKKYGRMLNLCPCCEFTKDSSGVICPNCPMLDCWGNSFSYGSCEMDASPYMEWRDATDPETHEKYAKIIADFAQAELEKL